MNTLKDFLEYKKSHNNCEFELRFQNIDIRTFYNVVSFFTNKRLERIEKSSVTKLYPSGIRSISNNEGKTKFEKKNEIFSFNKDGIKYSIAEEKSITINNKLSKSYFQRDKHRITFLDDSILIECTRVFSNEKLSFEIEIEIIRVDDNTKNKILMAKKLINSFRPSESEEFRSLFLKTGNYYIGSLPETLVETPINISDFKLSYKKDGERVMLFKDSKNNIFEYTRTRMLYKIEDKEIILGLEHIPSISLIDCEKMGNKKYIYFDVLFYDGKDQREYTLTDRLKCIKKDNDLLEKQKFHDLIDIYDYNNHITLMKNDKKSEGIVLTDTKQKYRKGRTNKILKVKKTDTIDLLIKKQKTLSIDKIQWELYYLDDNGLSLFRTIEIPIQMDKKYGDHSILEFEIKDSNLTSLRLRKDKIVPNYKTTIEDILSKHYINLKEEKDDFEFEFPL